MNMGIEFHRMLNKCTRVCRHGVSTSETERVNDNCHVCGTITDDGKTLDIRIMAQHDNEITWAQERAVKDILGFAVTRLSRIFASGKDNGVFDISSLPADTPIINQWEKESNKTLFRWVKRYTEKVRQIIVRWIASKDGRTETIVSIKNGLLHIHTIAQYPDYDIPEDGEAEILGLSEKQNDETNEIVNARLNYWREEERNGRL